MRPWPVAIAAALAAHAALALVVPVRRVAPPIAGPREPPAAPDPIEVTVATLDAPVAAGDRGAGAGAAQATHTAIATTVRRGRETPVPPGIGTSAGRGRDTPVPPGTGTPAGRAMMAMRRGAPPAPLAPLSARVIDDLLRHTPPRELLPEERIAEDIQQARHDHDWARLQALRDEQRTLDLQPAGHGTYRADNHGFAIDVDRDGTTHIRDKPTFDATDALMRAVGIDPYAAHKLEVLDRTRDTRAILQKRATQDRLAHAAQLMQGHIDRLWRSTQDLAARKQGLFELWDDCAESGSDEVLAGAGDARRIVVGWIQLKLLGADAYTAQDLARLNARRRSQARFEPYLEDR